MLYSMDSMLHESVAVAIEQNGLDCFLSWASWPEMESGRDDRVTWTITDVPFPFFNNVFNARLEKDDIASAIAEVTARFRNRRVPAFWWTGPSMRPSDLGRYLEEAGLELAFEAPAMAVDLEKMNEAVSPPAGFSVAEVTDNVGLREWCDVMAPVYLFPDFAAKAWQRMLASLGLGPDRPFRHFQGRMDGRTVATASLYLGAGVAGISSVATSPDYRRQGIGTALTVAALQEARKAGYRVGALFSSVMGEPMYRQIGFRKYGQGACYQWSPDNKDASSPK